MSELLGPQSQASLDQKVPTKTRLSGNTKIALLLFLYLGKHSDWALVDRTFLAPLALGVAYLMLVRLWRSPEGTEEQLSIGVGAKMATDFLSRCWLFMCSGKPTPKA